MTENVRDLEGILVSLMANAVINNREIDLPLTKRVVSQAVRLEKKQISVQMIQEIVCKYFNLEQSVIQTNSRKREIVASPSDHDVFGEEIYGLLFFPYWKDRRKERPCDGLACL